MVELLKQGQYAPFALCDQVVSILSGTLGFLDDVPIPQVRAFEAGLIKHVHDEFPEITDEITNKGAMSDEMNAKLKEVIGNFKIAFTAKTGEGS